MIRFGVIGYGYWGPNIVRNLIAIKETCVQWICDSDKQALQRAEESYPHIACCSSMEKVLSDKDVQVVAIITPPSTHYRIAKAALNRGKHIFIEKPFTAKSRQARELIRLAQRKKRLIMVDHTFIFTGAVQKMKEIIKKKILGSLCYYDSTRVSLGLIQQDSNVIWDLAPHDFSIMDYLLKEKPVALSAQGVDHLGSGHENMAYITVYCQNKMLAHINVNWLSPVKIRTTVIGGRKKMLLWDDLQSDEKLKIYDKQIHVKSREGRYRMLVEYRSGDMYSPRVDHIEALKRELLYFVDCLKTKRTPVNDGRAGLRIVKMCEAADRSLKLKGKRVKL